MTAVECFYFLPKELELLIYKYEHKLKMEKVLNEIKLYDKEEIIDDDYINIEHIRECLLCTLFLMIYFLFIALTSNLLFEVCEFFIIFYY